jgi:PfaD family protein
MADDIDAEADSGGHTDNRPALPLLSAICDLRDAVMRERGYDRRIRVGLAGGIGSPAAIAAAFAAGAAYVVTGSINQACVEAATSHAVKAMLASADMGAVAMAPAADMFEMGVNVQVLRHRNLFAARARKLYELYRTCASLDDIPAADRDQLERRIFRRPLATVWQETERFFRDRDPAQLERAAAQPKHRMALVFRWYLGMSSRWARDGEPERDVDYQVWCGAAMGAFNQWSAGTFLEPLAARGVVAVADALMHGACMLWRARSLEQQLAVHGIALPDGAVDARPRRAWIARPASAGAAPRA